MVEFFNVITRVNLKFEVIVVLTDLGCMISYFVILQGFSWLRMDLWDRVT